MTKKLCPLSFPLPLPPSLSSFQPIFPSLSPPLCPALSALCTVFFFFFFFFFQGNFDRSKASVLLFRRCFIVRFAMLSSTHVRASSAFCSISHATTIFTFLASVSFCFSAFRATDRRVFVSFFFSSFRSSI